MKKDNLFDFYSDLLTKKITEDWETPWFDVGRMDCKNYFTGKPYRNGNIFFLLIATKFYRYKYPFYLTFKQGKELGYSVTKGSKALPVYYYSFTFWRIDESGKKIKVHPNKVQGKCFATLREEGISIYPFLKVYNVFNVEQFVNLETGENLLTKVSNEMISIEDKDSNVGTYEVQTFEDIINNWECPIVEVDAVQNMLYNVTTDTIELTSRNLCKTIEAFYSSMLHEVAHSTGAKTRLNRFSLFDDLMGSRKESYAIEELVAELSSAFIMASNNLCDEEQRKNSAKYLQSWEEKIKSDNNLAFKVCSEAFKAISYIGERFPEAVNVSMCMHNCKSSQPQPLTPNDDIECFE
jgi:antirestriction protein ArdC